MDILNWLYLAKNKFVRDQPGSLQDLMIFGSKVGFTKRGDKYQNYAMEIGEFAQILPPGPAGPQGVAGVAGPAGAPGPVGPAGLNWQGAWSASGTYVIDDAVGYGGASWFCIANVGPTATVPSADPTKWALLAAQGATGATGATGLQGPTGATGPSGATMLLTTTGTGGNSSFASGTLNVPVYQTQIPHLEYNLTEKTVWNNGLGNILSSTSFGQFALNNANVFNFENSAFGAYALSNISQGYSNTGIGYTALYNVTTGYQNTAVGKGALYLNSANGNVAIGHNALNVSTTATGNAIIGTFAGNNLGAGSYNSAVGVSALTGVTTGNYNVAMGWSAMSSGNGSQNIAIGVGTQAGLGTPTQNVAIGYQALGSNSGNENTAVGNSALIGNTTGSKNTAIGWLVNNGNFSECVIIGAGATATGSNQFVVGSSTYNAGLVATETIVANRTWLVRINGANYKIPMVLIP
jgi:hypothetical protein